MKRSALLLVVTLAVAACSPADVGVNTTTSLVGTTTSTLEVGSHPVTVADDNGDVVIEERPEAIVSLSAVATEMLFAIGAGPQVTAVDDQSNYPGEAPVTDLSGFTPNVEAILALAPDLVVITFDPGDVAASMEAAGVPVITFTAAATLDDVYRQIEALGLATGHRDEALALNDSIAEDLEAVIADAPVIPEGTTYYHEIDNTLYSVTSATFFGQIYSEFGLVNIADEADASGSGYPQLSSEFVVASDPDLIFLADTLYGESAETVATRPGWDDLSAVVSGNVVELDSDVASRWGPRIVDFARSVAEALRAYMSQT